MGLKVEQKFLDSWKVHIYRVAEGKHTPKFSVLDYLQGKVKIDEYVTHHRKFAEISEGFHDMHVRGLCQLLYSTSDTVLSIGWRLYPMRGRHVLSIWQARHLIKLSVPRKPLEVV